MIVALKTRFVFCANWMQNLLQQYLFRAKHEGSSFGCEQQLFRVSLFISDHRQPVSSPGVDRLLLLLLSLHHLICDIPDLHRHRVLQQRRRGCRLSAERAPPLWWRDLPDWSWPHYGRSAACSAPWPSVRTSVGCFDFRLLESCAKTGPGYLLSRFWLRWFLHFGLSQVLSVVLFILGTRVPLHLFIATAAWCQHVLFQLSSTQLEDANRNGWTEAKLLGKVIF